MTPGFFLPYVRPQICGRFRLCKPMAWPRASAVVNPATRRIAASWIYWPTVRLSIGRSVKQSTPAPFPWRKLIWKSWFQKIRF